MRRNLWFIIGALAVGIAFISGALLSWQMPKIRSYVLVMIERTSRENLPVRVLPGAIHLSVIPLGIKIERVQVAPQPEFSQYLTHAEFAEIELAISPWQLLQGKLRLTEVDIRGAKIDASIPELEGAKNQSPLKGLFDLLPRVPINRIGISDIKARVSLARPEFVLAIDDLSASIEKRQGNTLNFSLLSSSLKIERLGAGKRAEFRIETTGDAVFTRTGVTASTLNIRRGDSSLEASLKLKGDTEALSFDDLDGELRASLNLRSLADGIGKILPDFTGRLPVLSGRGKLEAKLALKPGKDVQVTASIDTQGFAIATYSLDQIRVPKISYRKRPESQVIEAPSLSVKNQAGTVSLRNFKLAVADSANGASSTLSGSVSSEGLDMHELFKAIGIGAIPVYAKVIADLPCEGKLTMANPSDFSLRCQGQARAENFLVRSSLKSKSTIVSLTELDAIGGLTIDRDKVTYMADLKMPNSKGRSSGIVSFTKGFKIDYQAEGLSFKDVANLGDLKIQGTTRVKGSTEGDSAAASFKLELDGSDFWLEDFWLGNMKSTVEYKDGFLNFSNVQGYYSVSRYSGDLNLDLMRGGINLTARAPFFDARDLTSVFARKFRMPVAVTGTGQAQIKVNGPLVLNRLSYDLKSSLFRGSISGEPFDQAHFDVKSNAGEVKTERVQINKGGATVALTGRLAPDGLISAIVRGRDLRLENSVFVSSKGLALSGVIDFDMNLNGPIQSPDSEMRASLSKTSVGEQSMLDSTCKIKFGSGSITGDAVLFGDAIKADFILPFESASPFMLKISSQDWNYAPMLSAFTGVSTRKDYEGRLSGTLQMNAPSGGLWNSSGSILVERFSLSRGQLSLGSKDKIGIDIKDGQFNFKSFELVGENTFLKIANSPNPTAKLDAQVNGKIDLALLGIFTPFLEDLRGLLSFALNLRTGPGGTELLGSAYGEKGYVKIFDFPHPIEDARVDVIFNQKKVLINSLKAVLGGGRISGSGDLEFKGKRDVPTNISAQFEKVTLNIPDKVKTSGSGALSLTGNWFPFNLKIDYQAQDGLITKELSNDGENLSALRRDQFLPEFLQQERFTPINLEINVDFKKGLTVKNETVDGRVSGSLSVKGNPTKPSILGTVTLEKDSSIIVKDTEFEVGTANFQFTDPEELNPKLYLVAKARIQDYDVNLLLQGTASKPEPSFSSVPPLSEKEIISLLALGTTETRPNPLMQSNQTSGSSAPQIGAAALKNNPLSKELREKTGFDLQFEPVLDESSPVQKISIKRKFSDKLEVSASQSVGTRRSSEAEARYRLNKNVSGVASWQNRDQTSVSDKPDLTENQNRFFLDLEYKVEFK